MSLIIVLFIEMLNRNNLTFSVNLTELEKLEKENKLNM